MCIRDRIGDENIIRIARVFNVSTDFLFGVTNVPDRKNYEMDELGLSAQAEMCIRDRSVPVPSARVNCKSFFDFLTASQAFTLSLIHI